MKKLALISLALIMALGGLGVAYAHWSDTVYINQIVQTGKVEIGVFGVAPDPTEVENKDVASVTVTQGEPKFWKEIVESDLHGGSLIGPGIYQMYDSTTVTILNYYPSLTVLEDFYIGVGGTIPVKLDVTIEWTGNTAVYDNMTVSVLVDHNGVILLQTSGVASAVLPLIEEALDGLQVHPSDIVGIWIDKHLEQSAPQGEWADFHIKVTGTQWNLYGQ